MDRKVFTRWWLALLALSAAQAGRVEIVKFADTVTSAQAVVGGECGDGCTVQRSAVVTAPGPPKYANCLIDTEYTGEDPTSVVATNNQSFLVTHYCIDQNGLRSDNNEGSCFYELCTDLQFNTDTDELSYKISIVHGAEPLSRTVYVTLTMLYEADGFPNICAYSQRCANMEQCLGGRSDALVNMSDANGDGWGGAFPDSQTTWTIADSGNLSLAVSSGTLASGSSGEDTGCLLPGDYVFSVSEDAAWSADASWSFCGEKGGAGDAFPFTMTSKGVCEATGAVTKAAGPGMPTDSASVEPDKCIMPLGPIACTDAALTADLPAGIGAYYDTTCQERLSGGCGDGLGYKLDSCRLCVYSESAYLDEAAGQSSGGGSARVPDYVPCPCCVAAAFGSSCAAPTPAPSDFAPVSSDGGMDTAKVAVIVCTSVGTVCLICVVAVFLAVRRRDKRRGLRPPVYPAERSDKSGYDACEGGLRKRRFGWLMGHNGRPAVTPGDEDFAKAEGGVGKAVKREGRSRKVLPHEMEDEAEIEASLKLAKKQQASWNGEAVVPVALDADENYSEPEGDGLEGNARQNRLTGARRALSSRRRLSQAPPVAPEELAANADPTDVVLGGVDTWQEWQQQRAPAWDGNATGPGSEVSTHATQDAAVCSGTTTENGDM